MQKKLSASYLKFKLLLRKTEKRQKNTKFVQLRSSYRKKLN